MKKKWVFLAATLLAAIVLIVLFLSPEETPTYKFGYQPFGNNLPIFVALEKDYFEKEGVRVEGVQIISANDAAAAIARKELAANATVPLNVLLNIEERQPNLMRIFMVKATSNEVWSDYLLIKKGARIEHVEDLAGARVGGYPGSAQQALLSLFFSNYGLTENVTTVEVPPSSQLQALDMGQIDALLTYDELAMTALENEIGETLVEHPLGEIVDPVYGFPYVLGTWVIEEDKEAAAAMVRAMYRAVDFIRSDESEARMIMSQWVGTKPDIATKVQLWFQAKLGEIDRSALQDLADLFYDAKVTESKIDTSSLYVSEELVE